VRKLISISIVAAALLAAFSALALASSRRVWVTNCTRASYEPRTIVLACGDGSDALIHLKWSSWTRRSASGIGTNAYNTCSPNCAQGKWRKVPVRVTLSKPIRCRHMRHRVFKDVEMYFQDRHGRGSTQSWTLGCPIR
jgi:hypothetical protein